MPVPAGGPPPPPSALRAAGPGGRPAGGLFVGGPAGLPARGLGPLRPAPGGLPQPAEDHLDRYRDLAAYAASKRRLFRRQGAGDLAVLNADDPISRTTFAAAADAAGAAGKPRCAIRRRLFSRRGPVEDGWYLARPGTGMEGAPREPPPPL